VGRRWVVVCLLAVSAGATHGASAEPQISMGGLDHTALLQASEPITITSGGVYSGSWASTTSEPTIRIDTTEPVRITKSTIVGVGDLVLAEQGANVTLADVTGRSGSDTGRFFTGDAVARLTIRNCTISSTGGIYVHGAQPNTRITITRNRHVNVKASDGFRSFAQLDGVSTAAIDVSWNEVVNAFGQSRVEDNISLYRTSFAKVHDNYIQGGYPSSAVGGYSGSGIMIEQGSHHNEVYSNQVVETTNAGIGIASGHNNTIHSNRLVFDGKLENGTRLAAANVGLYVWDATDDPLWANNQAWGNAAAWVNANGKRNDWWIPHCSGRCENTRLRGVVNNERERAERRLWLEKLEATKIVVGRRVVPSR
jgi:Right handed beta helix region